VVARDITLGFESKNNILGLEGSQPISTIPSGRSKAYDQNLFKIYFLWR
jgi:hypothetical protein